MQQVDLKQEFRDLMKLSGWTQAEAARQLAITPGALSQIIRENSPVKPSQVTLRLFRILLQKDRPESLCEGSGLVLSEKWEVDLICSMRKLPPGSRAPLLKAFGMLIQANLAAQAAQE